MMRLQLLLVYGLVILLGLLVGFIGSLFELFVEQGSIYIDGFYHWAMTVGGFSLVFPPLLSLAMIVIAWALVHFISLQASGSGVPEIEGALLHVRPIVWRNLILVKFLSGALAISARMVLGREGPTIQMGGNLGEMVGEFFQLKRRRKDALIAAGAAAGLATAFNAPLAGVLFIVEEMRNAFNFSFTNFKMVAICCISATIVNRWLMGAKPAIDMVVFELPKLSALIVFFLFGILIGLAGNLFNSVLIGAIKRTESMATKAQFYYVVLVGLLIVFLCYVFPGAVGGGYNIIERSLSMRPSFTVLIALCAIRFVMTMLCYTTRVSGGIFAPILALGTLLGLAFSYSFNYFVEDSLQPGMMAVAGMGGLFSAVVRAPITGIVLVLEMTQNYFLLLPVMITCLTATTVMQLFRNRPIYTQLLNRLAMKRNSRYTQ